MGVTVDNVAKIGLTLDTANVFKQIDNIQERLNKLSVKNIKETRGEQVFDKIAKGAKKATEEAKTLQQAVREAENALSKAYYKNNTNPIWAQSEEAKKLVENVRKAKTALNDYNNVLKAVNEQVTAKKLGQVQNKDWKRQQTENKKQQKQLQTDVDKAWAKMKKAEESSSNEAVRIARKESNEKIKAQKELEKEATKAFNNMVKAEQKKSDEALRIAKKEDAEKQRLLEKRVNRAWAQMKSSVKADTNTELKSLKEQDKLDSRSYAQQIRDLKKQIASNYAKNYDYATGSQFDNDIRKLNNLITLENEYRQAVSKNSNVLNHTNSNLTYQQELTKARNEVQFKMRNQANYIGSNEYKKDIANIQLLQKEYDKLKTDINGVVEKKQEVNQTKIKSDDIDTYSKKLRQLKSDLENKALKDNSFIGSEEYKKQVSEIKNMQSAYNRLKNDIKLAKEESKGFKNYQTEMARVERESAKVYHEFANTKRTDENYIPLQNKLKELANEYQKLNKESVEFRKTIGISSSRGFYDLNSSYDYFLAKFRSKVTAGIAGIVEGYAMNAIPNFVEAMSNYQQNRVNFAQVLPDNVANDQNAMNQAMRDFTQIASDYGASVQEVTEAGRLWGRQYKDVAVIQELVRNSTKLSITDDMSLVEVNKGLEATMQQYNIHLKNANEAQETSGKIVDTWAKLADNAVVTASDLAKANEQSAGAAYQSGIGFDYLNAMIATMSSATGKAGAEIGRSIRSMLVSMQSNKAQKYFQELGIATKEIGTDGVMHVRSYEKVIDDLMKKLKSNPNDVSNVVLAMSGGKYQYNNVMALLKNYDNMQKNLQTARSSQGWADEQVGLQYQTISRQLKALTADFQQMIITLDQAGASAGINGFIQTARELVQILASINPENLKMLINTAKTFAELAVLAKIGTFLSAIKINLAGIIPMLRVLPSILSATANGILRVNGVVSLFSKMTGIVGVVVMVAQALYTLYDAWKSFSDNESIRNISKQTQELTQSTNGLIEEANNLANSGVDNIEKYVNAMKSATETLNSATASQQEKDEANKVLSSSEKALTDLIGDSAVQRIKASGYSKEAIEQEISTYTKMQITSNTVMQGRIQDEINTTQAVIESSQLRINQYQREMDSLYKLTRMRFEEARNAYEDYQARFAGKEDTLIAKMAKIDVDRKIASSKEATERMAKVIEEKGRYQTQNTNAVMQLNKLNMLKDGIIPRTSINDDYIKGGKLGITDDSSAGSSKGNKGGKGSKGSSGGSGSNKDYTEQLKRNELQTKRNELWYEASIQAKQYENTLKSITNDESYYGTTVASIMAKSNIYGERSKQLEDYQEKLENFRSQLQNELSQKMQANPQLMQATKYTVDMKGEELTKNIEVNKELYQQSKTVSNIINMISAVNQKLEETKSKSIDIANEQRKIADEISKQNISDIEQQASIDKAKINRPTNFDYSKQANQIELEAERAKLAQYEADLENTIQEIEDKRYTASMKDISALYKKQQTEIQLVEETKAKVAQLEYEKNSTIRQGLYDVTQQFLIQGNSLRDIWNNLWKDLAREALQRLFQIQAQASILGSLFGWSSGGSGKAITAGAGATKSISLPNYASVHSHTGSNVTGFKKMHTGGMVEQGRLGVVPKLKSDEVIRTLQIGEEVNSVSDRRSNEILATVAMKAIDSRNQQPNNINIMAIDSRSFAEYLNDNADVLLAVLNKQGALGRR